MKHSKHAALAALAAAFVTALCGCAAQSQVTAPAASSATAAEIIITTEEYSAPRSGKDMLECRFWNERNFTTYDSRSVTYGTDGGKLLCGVAPHHLTAGHFIAGMYKAAAASGGEIDTVVLVAPQHYPGNDVLVTSTVDWSTPFGVLEADTGAAQLLCDELGARCDDSMMQYDHSASSHIPFIRYYLPKAKVCCLLVAPGAGKDLPQRYAEAMAKLAEERKCFFAFSIDFSHYLSPDLAEMHDGETREAVLSGDIETILGFGNDNVDTPLGLGAFVELSKRLGGTVTEADNANTWSLGELPYSPAIYPEGVTSYFVFLTQG